VYVVEYCVCVVDVSSPFFCFVECTTPTMHDCACYSIIGGPLKYMCMYVFVCVW